MLTIALLATALADPGDTCPVAIPMAPNTTVLGNTLNRLPDGTPACGSPDTGGALWFTFTAPGDGVLSLDACTGSVVAPRVAVFADGCGTLTCVDGVEDVCGGPPLEVDVDSGVTYQVAVHKEIGATGGVFSLTNTFTAAPPTVEPPMDCTGRVPAVCQLTNRLVTLVNTEAGSLVLTESSPTARFRPTHLYTRVLSVFQTSSGGLYDRQAGVWHGQDFQAFVGSASTEGTLAGPTWSGDTGIFAPYGDRFGLYNGQGQVAGSSGPTNAQYVMGAWIRTAGGRGIYANVVGSCGSTDFADVFDPWFAGPLP